MADVLIETVATNPYDSIVSDTSTRISDLDMQIQQVSDAISNLEKASPTSPTLTKLRERLSSLQSQKEGLSKTNDSAKSLSNSFNQGAANINTLKGVYDLKEAQLEKDRQEANQSYRQLYDETRRTGQNYINALGNATASENAIINANAAREGASAQSTAEARARNYLSNAQAQNEAANTTRQQLNAIEEGRISSNQGYTQLSQSNADNYLRQQIMNDYQAAEAEKDRQLQRDLNNAKSGGGTSSRGTSNIFDPYSLVNNNNNNNNEQQNDEQGNPDDEKGNSNDEQIIKDTSDTKVDLDAGKYGNTIGRIGMYHNNNGGKVTYGNESNEFNGSRLSNLYHSEDVGDKVMVDLDRNLTNKFLKEGNSKWDLGSTFVQATDKGYLVFTDGNGNQKVGRAGDLVNQNQKVADYQNPNYPRGFSPLTKK